MDPVVRKRAPWRGAWQQRRLLYLKNETACRFVSDGFDVVGLRVGGGDPLLEVVEQQVGRDEALAADGEERWVGLPVPLGEAVEVGDWRLGFSESDGVT